MSAPARRGVGHRTQIAILAVLAAGSWALAFYFRMAPGHGPREAAPAASADPGAAPGSAESANTTAGVAVADSASATLGAATTSPGSDVGPSAQADAATSSGAAPASPSTQPSAAPSEPAPSPPGAAQEITACVASLFPPATLERGRPNLSFICDEPFPRQAVTQLQSKISLGQWGTTQATEGMREWAVLGWYELAALSLFRGHCCATTKPLQWSFKLACPLDVAMAALETAARAHDAKGLDAALQEYTKAAVCLTRLGQAPNFGQTTLPGPAISTFQKLVERSRKAPKH